MQRCCIIQAVVFPCMHSKREYSCQIPLSLTGLDVVPTTTVKLSQVTWLHLWVSDLHKNLSWELSLTTWQFQTNVIGTVHTLNAFIPLLSASAIKKAVVITTNVGNLEFTLKAGFSTSAGYGVSKAAVNMVVAKYGVAPDLKEKGLIFMGISPGLIKTMQENEGFSMSCNSRLVS